MREPRALTILGVRVDGVTFDQVIDTVRGWLTTPGVRQICTVNPEFVIKAGDDAAFRAVLAAADLNVPDGIGLLLAARRWGARLPERVAGSDLVYALAELAAAHGKRLFLLGAAPGVAEAAAAQLQARYPALIIAGTYAGSPAAAENDAIVARINAAQADLLYVAYGAPRQDLWIARNRAALTTVRVAIGVGGSLDFIAGRTPRAPRRVQQIGLEWLYRLYREPWRWRRMAALPRFVWRVLWTPPPADT